MRKLAVFLVAAALTGALGACASTGSAGGGGISGSEITAQELQDVPWSDLYATLSNHSWLEPTAGGFIIGNRGATALGGGNRGGNPQSTAPQSDPSARLALVLLDGSPITSGAESVLRGIAPEDVSRVRIMRPSEAATRFGTRGQHGAILIETGS